MTCLSLVQKQEGPERGPKEHLLDSPATGFKPKPTKRGTPTPIWTCTVWTLRRNGSSCQLGVSFSGWLET